MGPASASAALADATADLAALSRAMNPLEVRAFEARRGFKPTPVRVAVDAVTVLVNGVNPTHGLTLAQLEGIFSASRRCVAGPAIAVWGQLTPIWLSRPIQPVGEGLLSGTRDFFRDRALCGGEFKSSVAIKASPRDVVRAVRDSANAIGYVAMAFARGEVKAVPLASGTSGHFVAPTPATALSGTYPLTRYLYLYLVKPPGERLPPPVEQFMVEALSVQGQKRVAEAGYVPLPADILVQERAKLR